MGNHLLYLASALMLFAQFFCQSSRADGHFSCGLSNISVAEFHIPAAETITSVKIPILNENNSTANIVPSGDPQMDIGYPSRVSRTVTFPGFTKRIAQDKCWSA